MLNGGNRFQTQLATSLSNAIANTRYLGRSLRGGLSQFENPKWDNFENTGMRRKEALLTHSVSGSLLHQQENTPYGAAFGGRYNAYANVLYHTLDAEKSNRIYEYRLMAAFPEVANCIEEYTDNFIWEDERGHVVNLKYTDEDLPEEQVKDLEQEFQTFVGHFDFKNNGAQMCKDYITDGELFYEYLIDNSTPENRKRGILGVQRLQTELVEAVYKDKTNGIVGAFIGRNIVYNDKTKNQVMINNVPYHPNELFYIHSGTWDPSGEWVIPFIERARKPYVQLSYLEDAIVIYRLVRAPERLIFDIDCGNMPPHEAEAYIQSVQQEYWRSKSFDLDKADIIHKFEPQSMLDAFFLSRSNGMQAVQIEQLAGGQNLGQLDDLQFFLKALYRALRIPVTYLNEDAQGIGSDSSQTLRDELRFAKRIIGFQNKFAQGLRDGFITHLKLTGKYDEYQLKETAFEIKFCPPSNYYELRRKQNIQLDAAAFNTIVSNECISKSWAMKRVWGLTNAEIKQNQRLLMIDAINQWKVEQAKANGPFWETAAAMAMAQGEGGDGGSGDMGGDFGGGMDFGGDDMDFGGGDDLGGGDDDFTDDELDTMESDLDGADEIL